MPSLCCKPDPFTIFRFGVMGQKGGPQYGPKRSFLDFLEKSSLVFSDFLHVNRGRRCAFLVITECLGKIWFLKYGAKQECLTPQYKKSRYVNINMIFIF